jgi:SAM-dependent methyltransferase
VFKEEPFMSLTRWPKIFPPLTPQQESIRNDFVKHWSQILAQRYSGTDSFGHRYCVKHAPTQFTRTLEIGAGLGEHLRYERLNGKQESNYFALELRPNMSREIVQRFPNVQTITGDCQQPLPFADDFFERVLAIHVLEHLPNLPATIAEVFRVCNKRCGVFSVVIPCEGGFAYTLARRLSAQRVFEKRYRQPYQWFIEREHVNRPEEIFEVLKPYFKVRHRAFFPIPVPAQFCNLVIGLTLCPRSTPLQQAPEALPVARPALLRDRHAGL